MPSAPAPFRLQFRHAEGGDWFTLLSCGTEAIARDEVRARRPTERGDLLRLVGPRGATRDLWVSGRYQLLRAARPPAGLAAPGLGWEAAWEGPSARADRMLRAALALGVHEAMVTLAAAAVVEEALPRLPPGPNGATRAIEAARAWVRGEGTRKDADRASYATNGLMKSFEDDDYGPLFAAAAADRLALFVADGPWHARAPMRLVDLASYAAGGRGPNRDGTPDPLAPPPGALEALAAVVRREIPLQEVLLAAAGEVSRPVRFRP